jgi:putative membrane protein
MRPSRKARRRTLRRIPKTSMAHSIQAAFEPWTLPVLLDLVLILEALLYLRGWIHLRLSRVNIIPAWRACSFFLGLILFWLAVGSPLAALDEQLLTVHMVQHLLLMTLAPPLILIGAPVMPLLHGLPRQFVQTVLAPLSRRPPVQRIGRLFSHPAFCWFAASATLVGWHVPAAFTLALQSETWHVAEHSCFLVAGFLFWWPVIQPWPSVPHWPRWSILPYLFLATLPCDILSAYLTFCDRVVYPVYLNTPRPFGISPLADQQCAGALMWTCITIVYLLPAAILTTRLLAARIPPNHEALPPNSQGIPAQQRDLQSVETV